MRLLKLLGGIVTLKNGELFKHRARARQQHKRKQVTSTPFAPSSRKSRARFTNCTGRLRSTTEATCFGRTRQPTTPIRKRQLPRDTSPSTAAQVTTTFARRAALIIWNSKPDDFTMLTEPRACDFATTG